VRLHQAGERGRAQQRRVAGKHHDVAVVERVVLGQGGHGDAGCVARPPLPVLFDELDGETRRALLEQRLGDALGGVTDDDDGAIDRQLGQRVEDVQQHGPTTEHVQGLRPLRPHPSALARRHEHHPQRPSRAHDSVLLRESPHQ